MFDGTRANLETGRARLILLIWAPMAIIVSSWIYLATMIGGMSDMSDMPPMMAMPTTYTPAAVFGLLVMWVVMMAAMMLPTALPLILGYARMRSRDNRSRAYVLSLSLGYVAAWSAFSLAATAVHLGLVEAAMLSPAAMILTSPPVAGAILIAAGLYQFTPLKNACLAKCRSPTAFLVTQWREGYGGAFAMGWSHGVFCVGCCWALMSVLFVAGAMNAVVIIGLTAYVFAEKILPFGRLITQGAGILMIAAGVLIFVGIAV